MRFLMSFTFLLFYLLLMNCGGEDCRVCTELRYR